MKHSHQKPKKPELRSLKEIICIIKDRKILFFMIASLVLLLFNALGSLAFPALSAKIIDSYFAYETLESDLFIILGGIGLAIIIISYLQTFIIYLFSERFSLLARERLYEKTIQQPEKYFIENDKSKILTVIMSDVNFVKHIISQFVSMSVISILMIIGSAILMLSINFVLAIIIIVFVPISMLMLTLFMRKIRELFMQIQAERDNINRTIDENVKASMLVKVFTSEVREIEKFSITNINTYELQKKIIRKFAVLIPSVYFVMFFSTILIILLGGIEVMNGKMTLGQISAFSTYVTMFILPMMMLSMISTMIGQALASLERINSVLSTKNDFIDGKQKTNSIESIHAEKLFFEIGNKHVLKDINFRANKGEKIGLIGLTGSGKSILIQALLRLIEPSKGLVQVNGTDIKKFKIENIRKKVGIVFQDNYLIDDTIDGNIDFYRDLSAKDIEFARKVAEVNEFYKDNPANYKIGELGKKLSGGQKQRIRIARAIAGKPDLLILDDCTSNLDVETENKIISNIRRSLKDITIIIISQKITSLFDCDMIYVMDNGTITDKGTHRELLEKSLLYKEIELTQKNTHA